MVFDQQVLILKPKRKHTFSETAKTKELHQPQSVGGRPLKQRAAVQLSVSVLFRASCLLHAPV